MRIQKKVLPLLCMLLALVIVGGGAAWLRFSPSGVWNENGPEETMQVLLDTTPLSHWQSAVEDAWTQSVTPFEDRPALFAAAWEAATQGQDLRFRTDSQRGSRRAPVFLLSAAEQDLCCVELRREGTGWALERVFVPGELFRLETRTVSITVPEGTEVFVNGVAVGADYLAESGLFYEDMSELERRFAAPPTACRYEIPGVCAAVEVTLGEGSDAQLAWADGSVFRYRPADAGAYSFRLLAPVDAVVSVCGALLDAREQSGTFPLPLDVSIPEALAESVPELALYEATGLYSVPEITVTARDGTALEAVDWDGTLLYRPRGSGEAESAVKELVRAFLESYCRYGAHHFGYASVLSHVVEGSELSQFIIDAQPSLLWINGESVEFKDIRCGDFIPLGEDALLCSAHVSCTTTTMYEKQELEMDYQLLCLRGNGTWLVADMAYQ